VFFSENQLMFWGIREAKQETTFCLLHGGFLLGLLFDPKDEDEMLIQNDGLLSLH
jgi:hypothetical protein